MIAPAHIHHHHKVDLFQEEAATSQGISGPLQTPRSWPTLSRTENKGLEQPVECEASESGNDAVERHHGWEEKQAVPPMDQITVTTASTTHHGGDDFAESECSSVSLEEGWETLRPPRRSMFASYWHQQPRFHSSGWASPSMEPGIPKDLKLPLGRVLIPSPTTAVDMRMESPPQAQLSQCTPTKRRTIFAPQCRTQNGASPAFSSYRSPLGLRRSQALNGLDGCLKSSSAPTLGSSLRHGRYSTPHGMSAPASVGQHKRSVSFDEHIQVAILHPPMEQHADEEWIQFFQQ